MEIANSDMGKVSQWYKLKQRDLLNTGEELPPMETITMEQYQQTGVMNEEAYLNTADRILDPAKSLAETVSVHLKQPVPPIMAR